MYNRPKLGAMPKGKWWIRAVGKITIPKYSSKSVTPNIEVLIEKLPDDCSRDSLNIKEVLRSSNPQRESVGVGIGSVPQLIIGGVYVDQKLVGQIAKQEVTLTLQLQQNRGGYRATSIIPGAPHWWSPQYPYTAIAKSEYELGNYSDIPVHVFQQGGNTYIIPDHELFRNFFAPTSDLAKAILMDGFWGEKSINRLINTKISSIDEHGVARIVLRNGISLGHSPIVGNLCLTDFGKACVNQIYTNRIRTQYITAEIPFDTQALKIKATVIPLRNSFSKYLVTQITSITWPEDYVVKHWYHVSETSNARGQEVKTGGGCKPFGNMPPPSTATGISQTTIIEEEPNIGGPKIILDTATTFWQNFPEPKKLAKQVSYEYEDKERKKPPRPTDNVSTGQGKSGNQNIGKADVNTPIDTEIPLSDELSDIAIFIQSLTKLDKIKSAALTVPEPITLLRGSMAVWPMTLCYGKTRSGKRSYSAWSYLKRDPNRFRCALVFQIIYSIDKTSDAEIPIYWIEVEKRETEKGFCAFLMKRSDHEKAGNSDITSALTVIARHKANSSEITQNIIQWEGLNFQILPLAHKKKGKQRIGEENVLEKISSLALT